MEDKQYKGKILPLFEEDLNDAVDYISQTLKNPNAALRLIDSVQNAIEKRVRRNLLSLFARLKKDDIHIIAFM